MTFTDIVPKEYKLLQQIRLCKRCNNTKPLNTLNFYSSKNKTKFDATCKICRSQMQKTYKSQETIHERNKLYHMGRNEYFKQHYNTLKNSYNFKEYKKEMNKLYRENNKLKLYMYVSKRRALKKELNETFTTQDIQLVKERFEYKCFVCSSEERLEIDHFFPLSMGYILTHQNALLLCKSCNCSKNSTHPYEWFSEEQLLELREKYGVY